MDLSRRLVPARTALRRGVLRHRRPLAALLLALAAVLAVRAVAPAPPPSVAVLVAARDLPAGRALAPGDVATARLPPDAVPDGVVSPSEAPLGRPLAAPLRAGEPLTDVRLVGPGLGAGLPADTVAAPVRLADGAQAALLRAGERIDLLSTDPRAAPGASEVLATGAVVLAVPEPPATGDGALPGRLVVLGLRAGEARHVTAAAVSGYVTYTWSRG